jgi:hypothetical protein
MSYEVRKNYPAVEGFEDWAGDGQQFARVILGEKWQFTNDGIWVNADDVVISPDREVVVVDTARVLQKWIDQKPVETSFLASGEHPDIEQLNEACPRSEWSEDLNGKPRGPWQLQNVVYMVDMSSMQRFTFPTGTVGGGICVGELKDAVRMMRKFRGPGVYPVVSPSSKVMKTRFGKRQRPHFVIKRWISFGPEGTAALPPASPPSLQPPAPSSQGVSPAQSNNVMPSGTLVVEEPTLHEELNDSLPNW